jgi:phage tail sheath gpL-like
MASGATDPTISDAIALFGDTWYNIIAAPYTDATNLTAIEAQLASRYEYDRMLDGLYVTAKKATHGNMVTFGTSRNSPHVTCFAAYKMPSDTAMIAAAYAANIALYGEADSNPNLDAVELKGILPPSPVERYTFAENNILLFDGITTYQVGADGKVGIQRAITMYQLNGSGVPDEAYLEVATKLNTQYLRYSFRVLIQTKYARAKLANDNTAIRPGIQVITPKIGKAEAIAWFRQMEELGLVENAEQFKRDLICERDPNNPNRLNFVLPTDLVNLFHIGATTIQFRL